MSRTSILAAGIELAATRPYPERSDVKPGWHDRLAEYLSASVAPPLRALLGKFRPGVNRIVEQVARHENALTRASDDQLRMLAIEMRPRLRRDGFTVERAGECFALVREAASRTIGRRHYNTQLMAGWALLDGKLVEMATGEGKTIAATLPACAVAFAGYPAVVVTVNDYLARRDADELAPLYEFFGLSVGAVVQGMDQPARREAYSRAVTYCTNKELAFDYLRDGVALGRSGSSLHLGLERLRNGHSTRDAKLVLRGLCYCIVDEADSLLIDEARTPLILANSVRSPEEAEQCRQALEFTGRLSERQHYSVDVFEHRVSLTDAARAQLDEFSENLDGLWTSSRAREELIEQALSAIHLYRRDQHYVVSEGKVQIVDESTGRVMPDRSWERGLHQMIEAKEGCELTPRSETLARLTYQRLFRRYLRLSGMTGTAAEARREIRQVYGLEMAKIPLHRPSQRIEMRAQLCPTSAQKWQQVAAVAAEMALHKKRPVLIGTRSVQASEQISALLSAQGVDHALLNAKQDASEADVIALAGQASRVTVATNMAGRGTDIKLGPGVAESGGLHVILTEYHESRRIDRQLFGRCARQGDPGSCQAIVSLDDEMFTVHAQFALAAARVLAQRRGNLPQWTVPVLRRLAQSGAERRNAAIRVQNQKQDRQLDQMLAFSGKGE